MHAHGPCVRVHSLCLWSSKVHAPRLCLSKEQSAFLEEEHSTLYPVSILPKDSTFLIAASLYSIPTSFLVLTLTELAAAGGQKQKAALEKLLNLRPRQDPPRCTHE